MSVSSITGCQASAFARSFFICDFHVVCRFHAGVVCEAVLGEPGVLAAVGVLGVPAALGVLVGFGCDGLQGSEVRNSLVYGCMGV